MSGWLQKHTYINELVGLWAKAEEIQDKVSREIKAGYSHIGSLSLWINTAEKSGVWLAFVNLYLNAITKFRKCLEDFFNLAWVTENITFTFCPINFKTAWDQLIFLLSKYQLLADIVGLIRKWKEQQWYKNKTAYTPNNQK